MKSLRLKPCAAAVAIAALQMANPAHALNCTLTTSGLWQTPGDWSCGARPGNGDAATISVGGLVTINQAEQITTLSNAGTINIDAFTLTLLGGGSTTNSGIINVGGASTASLQVLNNIANAGGTINIGSGSVVNQFGTTISGGTINTTGSGALVASGSAANFLNNVALNGTLDLATSMGTERITGNLALNGAINVNNNSLLNFDGANTLSGNAVINLGDTGASNRIGIDNSGILSTGANVLIHGKNGTIGQALLVGGASTLNNGGTISADVAGGSINLLATQTNNAKALTAQNGGQLVLSGNVTQTASGTAIAQGTGSSIFQNAVTIAGGTIGGSGGGAYVASGSGSNFLSGVAVAGLVDLASANGSERVLNGLTLNAGSNVAVNNNSVVSFEGNNLLTGSGSITLGDTGGSNRIGVDNSGVLTVDSNVLIHGKNGTIGQAIYVGGAGSIVNRGTIAADVAGGSIEIVAATTNNGVLSASNGGRLVLSSNVTGNPGSVISAAANSQVLQNGVTISGTINTTGSGLFTASGSGNNYFNGVTLGGTLDLATSTGSERVFNNLALNGAINVDNNSVLSFEGNNTLSGNGVIDLGSTGASNRIGIDNSGVLTVGPGITIRGQNGTIGQPIYIGGQGTLVNNGTISADVAGGSIQLVAATTNNGTLSAVNGGTLHLQANVNGAIGSSINVGAGSAVLQEAVTLGGVINTTGSGTFAANGSGNNYLSGVTLNGNLDLATNNGTERVIGNLALNGTIGVNNNSVLSFEGINTLSGNGTITLGGTGASNRIGIDNTGVLTTGANTLIHGSSGTIGQAIFIGGAPTLINNGTISADVAGGSIQLVAATTNNGTLAAANGGTLRLQGNVTGTAGSSINAGTGSTVIQEAVTLSGVINTAGSGTFTATGSGNNYLSGVTLNGVLDLASSNGAERVIGNLALNGTINVNNNSVLSFENGNTLSGTGTITLGDTGPTNRIGIDNSGVLTTGANTLIHGKFGTIGQAIFIGGASTLNNGGTISADVAGGSINLLATQTNNAKALTAQNGGQLVLSGNVTQTAAGTAIAQGTGSSIFQNAVTVAGGTIGGSGGGAFIASGSGSNFLSGVSVSGLVDLASSSGSERVINGMTLNAGSNVAVNNNSVLSFENDNLLTGSGSITLGNSGGSNRIGIDNSGTLTVDTNVLIHGQSGTIGQAINIGGSSSLVNRGTIGADVAGGSIVVVANNVTNNGLLSASAGTLTVNNAFGGTGTVQTAGTGQFNVGASSAVGNLINNGTTASALNLGANNLTVSVDYSNANFGVGNGFNKHAGVAGTGQILASGNVAQAITGATVTNGGTASPTLTIGNVRVGSTNYDYQIANTGTSGPALRGAIETGVNGGSITDARLSGNGATAGNYGPVATGSSTARSVTFTTATAGLLAPLSGAQSVHIANNFDNVAEQTLNIALGAGAAAYNAAIGSATPSPAALGNVRVGGTLAQAFTVRNTASAGSFSEDLNAAFGSSSGNASGTGSLNGLVAGGVNGSALVGSLNTATSGARSGTVTVNYTTAGTVGGVSNGLGTLGVGSQTIALSGNVYQAAAGTITTAPYNFGTVQVGQSVSQNITVLNSATGAAGFVEDLNASFGASTASQITGSGSINGLLAGASSSGLQVNVNTSQAGLVNGSIAVNFASAGAVGGLSNGLGTLAVGSANYGVSGTIQTSANVVNQAAPVINNSPIALGNVRIGSASPTGTVSVTNQAVGGQQAALNASIAGNGGITASGSFNGLVPGATNNGSLVVGLDTSTAGNKSGNATIGFVSDASNIGNCAPNCQMTIASQNVAVNGAVYRLANPNATPTTITVAGRVGQAAPTTAIGITNVSPDLYTEGLSVARGATSAGFTSTGSITNLAANGSSTAIGVSLNTATAGTFSGSQVLNYTSTGAGTTGAADLAIGSGSVTLDGKVYTTAVATNNTPTVDFGIVHVGDTVNRSVSVTNAAAVTALNDTLSSAAIGATGPFTASGTVSGLTAGNTSTALAVGLNTATAGVYAGSAAFSAASHDADLSDAALANLAVSLSGTVNNYATDRFSFASGSGSLTQVGSTYILDYGTVAQNSGTLTTSLLAGNGATGPADLLAGTFQFLDALDFGEAGFGAFASLAAGQNTGPLTFSFNAMTVGAFTDTITLHGVGSNGSGYSAALGDIQLIVRGTVTGAVTPPVNGVPEPDSLILLGLGIPLLFLRRNRNTKRSL